LGARLRPSAETVGKRQKSEEFSPFSACCPGAVEITVLTLTGVATAATPDSQPPYPGRRIMAAKKTTPRKARKAAAGLAEHDRHYSNVAIGPSRAPVPRK
jgi:hypothetical protein